MTLYLKAKKLKTTINFEGGMGFRKLTFHFRVTFVI